MYSIYADGTCIYNDIFPLENTKVLNPKLILEGNAAGSLSVKLTPANAGYSAITRLVSDISVRKDGQEIWAGRVLSENMDFWNNRVLYCEGELAFFNDSVQPPAEYANRDIADYLRILIEIHNGKVGQNRQFALGAVTVHDANLPTFYTNYEKTMELLNGLVEKYGGYLRVRKEDGVRYLDYLADCPNTCTQVIQFGKNLIDFTKQWDMTEFATVIIPLGKRLDDSDIEELDAYLTIEEVNGGKNYIYSEEAVAAYGWVEKTVTWDEVEDPSVLLDKARTYLSEIQFDNMVLELSALDMHYLNVDAEAVKLLDQVRVISPPHGLNRLFPVTKLEIPLDSPEKTQFKLGDAVRTSLTSVSNQVNTAILEKIENLPKAHSVLKTAKANARAIMDLATNGYITITKDSTGSEALIISSEQNYKVADRYWKWNMNGLAYFKRDQDSGSVDLPIAITMDGAIVADFITTGTMSADRVRAGILESTNKNVVFDLDTGKLTMKSGLIQLGEYSNGHYQFEVGEDGHLYAGANAIFAGTLNAAKGSFGGQLVAATGNFKGVVQASQFLDAYGNDMMDTGRFKSKYLDVRGLNVNNHFIVDESGNVTINGGAITWSSTIPWSSVNVPSDLAKKSEIPSDGYITSISERAIQTTNVTAVNLHVKAANIDDEITVPRIKYGNYTFSVDPNDAPLRAGDYGFSFTKTTTNEDVFSLFDWNSGSVHTATMTVKNWGVFTFFPDSWSSGSLGAWGKLQINGDVDIRGTATGLYLRFTD